MSILRRAGIVAALADAMDADGGWSPDVRFTVRFPAPMQGGLLA